MDNEAEKRKEAIELAIKTAAACPEFFSKSATGTERTLGDMIVREAKTIYGYLFPEGKQ
jgi:hypothetical protein